MRLPATAALLDAWEQTLGRPPANRPLALLAAVYPDVPYDELARLSVGGCDSRLLALRESLFGPRMSGVSSCPQCGERIEMEFSVSDLRVSAGEPQSAGAFAISADGHEVAFRLPTCLDLEAAAASDAAAARGVLLARCLLASSSPSGSIAPDILPSAVVEAVAEAMGRADPQAAAEIALSCPACSHRWTVAFDAGSFLWSELNAWAQQMLRDIHVIANAYGWSETQVLALSPARRRAYLDLVQS